MNDTPDERIPRLAPGCRLTAPAGEGEESALLIPEGMLRLRGTGRRILELCDGRRTVAAIVAALRTEYSGGDPARIEAEVLAFLAKLQERRVIDY